MMDKGADGNVPISIVGARQSGMRLLRGVIGAHPNITCSRSQIFLFVYWWLIFEGSRHPVGIERLPENGFAA
jgi:hypothetical protein